MCIKCQNIFNTHNTLLFFFPVNTFTTEAATDLISMTIGQFCLLQKSYKWSIHYLFFCKQYYLLQFFLTQNNIFVCMLLNMSLLSSVPLQEYIKILKIYFLVHTHMCSFLFYAVRYGTSMNILTQGIYEAMFQCLLDNIQEQINWTNNKLYTQISCIS